MHGIQVLRRLNTSGGATPHLFGCWRARPHLVIEYTVSGALPTSTPVSTVQVNTPRPISGWENVTYADGDSEYVHAVTATREADSFLCNQYDGTYDYNITDLDGNTLFSFSKTDSKYDDYVILPQGMTSRPRTDPILVSGPDKETSQIFVCYCR